MVSLQDWHITLTQCHNVISSTSLCSSLLYSALSLSGASWSIVLLYLCVLWPGEVWVRTEVLLLLLMRSPLSSNQTNTKGTSRPCRTSVHPCRLPSKLNLSIFHSLKWQSFGRFVSEAHFYWWVRDDQHRTHWPAGVFSMNDVFSR